MHEALTAISTLSLSRRTDQIERLIGRLRSMVAYVQVSDVIRNLHSTSVKLSSSAAIACGGSRSLYDYPIEVAFEN